jgi:hypothetical protein
VSQRCNVLRGKSRHNLRSEAPQKQAISVKVVDGGSHYQSNECERCDGLDSHCELRRMGERHDVSATERCRFPGVGRKPCFAIRSRRVDADRRCAPDTLSITMIAITASAGSLRRPGGLRTPGKAWPIMPPPAASARGRTSRGLLRFPSILRSRSTPFSKTLRDTRDATGMIMSLGWGAFE